MIESMQSVKFPQDTNLHAEPKTKQQTHRKRPKEWLPEETEVGDG